MRRGLQDLLGRRGQPLARGLALAVAVVLVGLLAFRQFDRWRGKEVTTWVAAEDLEAGTELTAEHLTPVEVRKRSAPRGAVLDRAKVEAAELVRPKAAGATILIADIRPRRPDRGSGLAAAVPEGRVMMPYTLPGFPIAQLADQLRSGDRLDVFSFLRGEPLHIARDAIFLGWIRPRNGNGDGNGNGKSNGKGIGSTLVGTMTEAAEQNTRSPAPPAAPTPLLLGVRPEDVRRLVWAKNSGLPLTAVLHGRLEVESGELLGFPAESRPRAAEVEVILGDDRVRQPLRRLK